MSIKVEESKKERENVLLQERLIGGGGPTHHVIVNSSLILCSGGKTLSVTFPNNEIFPRSSLFYSGFEYVKTKFPTLQVLGEDLVTVLDFLHVKYVIGLGEGAGANVIARFGIAHTGRTLGLILINCTGSSTSVKENFNSKFINWKGKEGNVNQSASDYLVFHKFGHQLIKEIDEDKEKVLDDFMHKLRGSINHQNVKLYVNAFLNRTDLPLKNYKGDVLLITGSNGSYANVVEKLYKELDKKQTTLLRIEKAGDVLSETPGKVARSILLFCKGLGLLTSVTLPGVERHRTFSGCTFDGENRRKYFRGMSMEEYDTPNIRRFSLTPSLSTESK